VSILNHFVKYTGANFANPAGIGFNKYTVDDIKKLTENNGMSIIKTIEIQKDKSYCIISKTRNSEGRYGQETGNPYCGR
jgi:effector-binding domain-containing protein